MSYCSLLLSLQDRSSNSVTPPPRSPITTPLRSTIIMIAFAFNAFNFALNGFTFNFDSRVSNSVSLIWTWPPFNCQFWLFSFCPHHSSRPFGIMTLSTFLSHLPFSNLIYSLKFLSYYFLCFYQQDVPI